MTATRHRTRRTAFNGILILIGLALFTVQLSDKFYLFSNKPFINIPGNSGKQKVIFTAKSALSNNSYFFPDKRFHSGNSFALSTPVIYQQYYPVWRDFGFYTGKEAAVCATFLVTALRGPPDLKSSCFLGFITYQLDTYGC